MTSENKLICHPRGLSAVAQRAKEEDPGFLPCLDWRCGILEKDNERME